jgi:hypothetical protein
MGAAIAGMSNGGGVATPEAPGLVEPPAMSASPIASPEADELAASPWNTANNLSFNRALLPSAMVAAEPLPEAKKPSRELAPEVPSRMPWIIVGLLVLVAIASGVAVFLIRGKHGGDGQIAVPAGGSTTLPDEPTAETAAPTTTVSAAAPRPVPTYRPPPVVKPKPVVPSNNDDDPYGGTTRKPSGPAPHRIFGTEN